MLGPRAWSVRSFATGSALRRNIMTLTKMDGKSIKFGPYEVTKQVFLTTKHSFALVNLKPLIPGHILVCPLLPHRRITDLSPPEIHDLFTTVQLTQRLLARTYFPTPEPEAGSFSVAVQDGAEAGQTVPHVHVHVIPRQKGDLKTTDEVYVLMAGEEGNVGGALWDHREQEMGRRPSAGGGLPKIEDGDRVARSFEEMRVEVERYRQVLKDMGVEDTQSE